MIILAILSYLIGSFPTAYLFDKKIFKKGTGNMGTFNYLLENKNLLKTSLVLGIDILKGIIILSLSQLLNPGYLSILISVPLGIIGHSYSLWVGFKGGKGLALACGAVFLLQPIFFTIGIILLGILYLITKNHITAGLIGVPIVLGLALFMHLETNFLILAIMCAVLIAHKDVIKKIF